MEKFWIAFALCLCALGIGILSGCIQAMRKEKKMKREREDEREKIKKRIDSFFDDFEEIKSNLITNEEKFELLKEYQRLYTQIKESDLDLNEEDVKNFLYIFENLNEVAERENEKFFDPEGSYEEWKAEEERKIKDFIHRFYEDFDKMRGVYITKPEVDRFKESYQDEYDFVKSTGKEQDETIGAFLSDFENLRWLAEEANREYIEKEKRDHAEMFKNIDGMALDDQQQTAVVADEVYNLVVAGAGSGKTLTVAGKVKYLCDCQGVKPEDILLITFTNKAVEEMNNRVNKKLGVNVKATTFHRLGLDILRSNGKPRLSIVDNPREFIEKYFRENVLKSPKMMKKLLKYFAYYITTPANLEEFGSIGEAYEYEKTAELETISSKYKQAVPDVAGKGNNNGVQQIAKREVVKSLDEVEIANFLFLNGIEYVYDKAYCCESEDGAHKVLRPSFYLPQYNIWIDYYKINREERAPWLSETEEQKYLQDIEWRRAWYQKYGAQVIEMHHSYSTEGRLLDELELALQQNGVVLSEPDLVDVFSKIYGTETERYFAEFINLCCMFITLYKSNGYKTEDLAILNYADQNSLTPYKEQKLLLFKEIVGPVITEYQNFLKEQGAVDFSDMINKATECVRDGAAVPSYKYIIVDEYQDVSMAQYRLIKELLDRTGAHLFCVGDDWQSIYRFAGSDIGLFSDFEDKFGYAAITALKKTYRNSIGLISEAGDFIMKNPKQMKKVLTSGKDLDYPISFIGYKDSPAGALKWTMDKIAKKFGTEGSVMILGRTQHDLRIIQESGLFELGKDKTTLKYRTAPKMPVSFLTVHKAKGLEADNVILLNFENKLLGFPNKIADDPILGLVLSTNEEYRYAEERRLLYVALTRTKNRVFVLTDLNNPSEFLREFEESNNIYMSKEIKAEASKLLCPRCKTGHLVVRVNEKNGNNFLGCSNYPKCDYTINDLSVFEDQKICPECGGYMIKKSGKYGKYYLCSNNPVCKHMEK